MNEWPPETIFKNYFLKSKNSKLVALFQMLIFFLFSHYSVNK